MASNYMFGRQDAEAMVDLLEEQPTRQLHDHTCQDMADELRKMFGMCTRAEDEAQRIESNKHAAEGGYPIKLPPHFEVKVSDRFRLEKP